MHSGHGAAMPSESPVNVYIDGFNFYYAIHHTSNRDVGRLKRAWCNFAKLAELLVGKAFPNERVGAVKYFTAPVRDLEQRPEEGRRQELWLQALEAGSGGRVRIIRGFHAKEGAKPRVEKQTDVNIAISIVRDSVMAPAASRSGAYARDPFSPCRGVVLVSADRDLVPALRMVDHYGVRPVRFRPGFEITDDDLWACLLPDTIERKHGPAVTWREYAFLKSGWDRW